jgi:hypothetical protein
MMERIALGTNEQDHIKYVFVCGMPRSGTSILGRNIARMENCTGLHDTGVLEDEGRYLQDVYPTEGDCGGPGRFGFDRRTHLTETSPLLTPENALKLRQSWEQYWDERKGIRVEKTPANLLMTRFLQAAFPNAYFVVIRRHPVPVSIATQKWKVSITSLHTLFEHWLHCHRLFEEDKKHLKQVYELTYEDYVQDPDKYHQEIAAFIGTRVPEPPKEDTFRTVAQWRNPGGLRVSEITMEDLTAAHNQKYLDKWSYLLTNSRLKKYYRYIAQKYEPRFARYGYSLTAELGINDELQNSSGRVSVFLGPMRCLGADISAFLVRSAVRTRWGIKQAAKAILPHRVLEKVRWHAKQRV